jgi:hypothetical protein
MRVVGNVAAEGDPEVGLAGLTELRIEAERPSNTLLG